MTEYRRSYSEMLSPWDLASARNHSRAGSVSVIPRTKPRVAHLGSPRDFRLDEFGIVDHSLDREERPTALIAAMTAQERAVI